MATSSRTAAQRWACRLAWQVADALLSCPETPSRTWWIAALLRFATTAQRTTVTRRMDGALVIEDVDTRAPEALDSLRRKR